ncbi:LytR family transcriptional regulator [Streptomyces sp. TRM43335]|uniref:LytR family transcriptional regulator n=1 Tax=Streptomyces taklimakanensis TaxID=2569853 RepID=A0A6G2BG31_9ACTN|nr:LCP family protein [Streptomyces taklimakanensis]MTE21029.1 LytR family transcriptional regulator [Streptomyces taklimakanensis]
MTDDETSRDGGATGPGERSRDGGRGRRGAPRRAVVWGAVGALVLAAVGFGALYLRLDGNIAGIDIEAALGGDRPADTPGGSMDILVLGSDTRSGGNDRYGRDDGTARADTAMIVHVNEARDRMGIVSVPRDTLVERPECARTDGGTAPPARRAMFNTAYEIGGPVCAVKTVESMTGIRMDHYVEIDFIGFEKVVDALDGVPITTTEPIEDEDSGLRLDAGRHTLDGEQALALVRTRKSVGNGSDLARIDLQHVFVRAFVDRVGELGVLSDPGRLYRVADTATSALTTDADLASTADLVRLAETLEGIDSEDVRLVTLPVRQSAADPNRVVPIGERTERIWAAFRADRPIPESVTEGSAAERAEGAQDVGKAGRRAE